MLNFTIYDKVKKNKISFLKINNSYVSRETYAHIVNLLLTKSRKIIVNNLIDKRNKIM